MITIPQIIKKIDEIAKSNKYIIKKDKDYIKDNLALIKDKLTEDDANQVNQAIELVSQPTITIPERQQLDQLKPSIKRILKKYEEEFIDEPNEEEINPKLTTDEVEELLDDKINSYKKYTDKHPMEGITWDSSSNKYKIQYCGLKTNTKNIELACEKIMKKFEEKNSGMIVQKIPKIHFAYHNHYFLSYWHKNEPLFDIQHIISVLNVSKTSRNDKYNKVCENNGIVYYKWHQNRHNGFILRELINEKTMYSIIMNSTSDFSKKFKLDVAEILIKLRKDGKLKITNNKMSLNKRKNILMNEVIDDQLSNIERHICSYDSISDMLYIKSLIFEGSLIQIGRYNKKQVMYLFIIPLKTNHRYVIIKIGYTNDIIKRIISLQDEYKSKCYLISLHLINGRPNEETFHDNMKIMYPHLIQEYKIKKTDKTELYKLSPIIIDELNTFVENLNIDIIDEEEIELSKEDRKILALMKNQEKNFTDNNSGTLNKIMNDKILLQREKHLHERYVMKHEKEQTQFNAQIKEKQMDKELLLTNARTESARAQEKANRAQERALIQQTTLESLRKEQQRAQLKKSAPKHIIRTL